MNKTASMLSKMADKLLKSADKADAYAQSQVKYKRIKFLHEAMTERYKFYISNKDKATYVDQVKSDIEQVKKLEKKLTLTTIEDNILNRLFAKYRVD
jgi:tRNA U34 5-carboxymethylaminomethyl modifying GTPase MnmE/TrmE